MSVQALLAATAHATAKVMPGVNVTVRLYQASTFTPSTGGTVLTYHDVAVRNVLKDTASVKDVAAGNGALQFGDVKFVLARHTLSDHFQYAKSGDLSTSDLIVHGTTTYRVMAWETFGNDTMLRIFARKQD